MTNAILVLKASFSSLKFAVDPAAEKDCGALTGGKVIARGRARAATRSLCCDGA